MNTHTGRGAVLLLGRPTQVSPSLSLASFVGHIAGHIASARARACTHTPPPLRSPFSPYSRVCSVCALCVLMACYSLLCVVRLILDEWLHAWGVSVCLSLLPVSSTRLFYLSAPAACSRHVSFPLCTLRYYILSLLYAAMHRTQIPATHCPPPRTPSPPPLPP